LVSGEKDIWFVFQKMKYMYDSEERKCFKQVKFPVDWQFKQYMEWKGYQEEEDITKAEKQYGRNRWLSIR